MEPHSVQSFFSRELSAAFYLLPLSLSHFSWKNFGLSAHTNFSFGAYKIISTQSIRHTSDYTQVALLPVTSIKLFSLSEPQFEFL